MIHRDPPSGPSADVDAVLAALPADMRDALQALRESIVAAVPEAVESISYGVPSYRYRGRPLVSFGAARSHASFYVQSPAVMEAHAALLGDYDTSKGTVRFSPDRPIPEDLVQTLVRARVAETDAIVR